uniref:Putative reverse transcriptase domain-containing protein n=1 Tax=Tanacetum cinerariifolium TaxID=118510 RepID=A0A699SNH2_TANCI|nr:putative reverse transcriptase domain-containing protein [Tanacetum cinerariifolium]
MYHDLKQHFWWSGMKRDVATFVSRCLMCQQVKIKHQRASGLLQPLDIPVGERVIEGPEMIEVTNEVAVAKEKLKEARTR